MIPAWLPVAVPWAGAALLAALPRRPALAGPAVAAASLLAAAAFGVRGGAAAFPGALAAALLVAGALSAFLIALSDLKAEAAPNRDGRFLAAGFPALQGAQALALLATDATVAWVGLAACAGAGAGLVALSGGRRGATAAWSVLLLCGAGLALALLGSAVLRAGGTAAPSGLGGVGFVLLLLGYGALGGLAPMRAWLPRAVAASAPPVGAALAGLLPPAALHALARAGGTAAATGTGGGPHASVLLAALGLLTVALAAWGAWRRGPRWAAESPGWGASGLAGLAALGFGLGGAAGNGAGALLLVGLPFCVGAAVLGAAAGGPVAALGRAALAGMPPFAPFAALALLFSAVAALPAWAALPLGAALLLAAAAQLVAAAKGERGAAPGRRGGPLAAAPAWALLGLALAMGAALPEPVAAVLAGAAGALR